MNVCTGTNISWSVDISTLHTAFNALSFPSLPKRKMLFPLSFAHQEEFCESSESTIILLNIGMHLYICPQLNHSLKLFGCIYKGQTKGIDRSVRGIAGYRGVRQTERKRDVVVGGGRREGERRRMGER